MIMNWGKKMNKIDLCHHRQRILLHFFSSSAKATNPDLERAWHLRHHLLGDCLLGTKLNSSLSVPDTEQSEAREAIVISDL